MYDRLLVAVDHSETSPRVIAAAKELALLSKGKVWVLHLLEKEVIAQMGDVPSESDQEAAQPVRDGVNALKQAGVDAEGEIRSNHIRARGTGDPGGRQGARRRRHHHGLPGPERLCRGHPRQHRAQGDPSG